MLAGVVVNMKYRSPDSRIVGFVGAVSTMIILTNVSTSPYLLRASQSAFAVLALPPTAALPPLRTVPFDFYAN